MDNGTVLTTHNENSNNLIYASCNDYNSLYDCSSTSNNGLSNLATVTSPSANYSNYCSNVPHYNYNQQFYDNYNSYYQHPAFNYYSYYNNNFDTNYQTLNSYNVASNTSITNGSGNLVEKISITNINGNNAKVRSPSPCSTESTKEATPASSANTSINHEHAITTTHHVNISQFPTPPCDDEFSNTKEKMSLRQSIEKSPEIIPREDSCNEQSDDGSLQSQARLKRRTRTQFTKYQIDCLESIFLKNHYPDVQTVDHLSEKLGLAIERISVWFQNRRAKFKKTKKPADRNSNNMKEFGSISLCGSNPLGFQKFANHIAPKPVYPSNGIHYQNYGSQLWPNFNSDLLNEKLNSNC